jgi:phosphopantothenoylcysteine decarboxylase/phosphopantothenate--cysteine ligase
MTRPAAIVTTGPASVPIDKVRRITNAASGEIGALLAEALIGRGWEVFVCRGTGATHRDLPRDARLHEFATNQDLAGTLEELSETRGRDIAGFFHSAALADYDIAALRGPDGSLDRRGKLPGDLAQIHLVLEPAEKILPRLRGWFPRAWIAGWKYELEGTREDAIVAGRGQLASGRSDATVVNGAAYGPGFGLLEEAKSPLHFATKRELADFLASRAMTAAKADE